MMQTYPMFLDGNIGEVNKHVVQFTCTRRVLDCAEPAEAQLVPESQQICKIIEQTSDLLICILAA